MRPERRRHERIRIRAEARLQDGGKEAHLHARDLSLGGAFVAVEPGDGDGLDFAEGVVVDLLLCPDEEGPHHAVVDGASLHASARIVRAHAGGLGLQFEHIDFENEVRLRAMLDVEGD